MPSGRRNQLDNQPVTKAELTAALNTLETHVIDTLTEKMRDMQTEVLRAFESFAAGQNIRLRKLEADHSNLDAALTGRVEIVERRLFEIEKRLMIDPPKPH